MWMSQVIQNFWKHTTIKNIWTETVQWGQGNKSVLGKKKWVWTGIGKGIDNLKIFSSLIKKYEI